MIELEGLEAGGGLLFIVFYCWKALGLCLLCWSLSSDFCVFSLFQKKKTILNFSKRWLTYFPFCCYMVCCRGNEGRELLEECLLITEKYKGKDHPSSVTHLINLATSYSQSKNYVQAERLLRTSLEIMMKSVRPDDSSITFPMLHLAVTLYRLNQDKEAEQLTLEVLRIREKAFGKDSLPVGKPSFPFIII